LLRRLIVLALLATGCGQQIDLPAVAPLADAGDDQLRLLRPGGTTIGLDARGSCDPSGNPIEHFRWQLREQPNGVTASVAGEHVHTSFVADAVGRYVVALTVDAAGLTSDPDEVVIELSADLAADQPPSAPDRDRCGNPLY